MKAIVCDICGQFSTTNIGKKYNTYASKDGKWRIQIKAGTRSDVNYPHDVCPQCVIEILKHNLKNEKVTKDS